MQFGFINLLVERFDPGGSSSVTDSFRRSKSRRMYHLKDKFNTVRRNPHSTSRLTKFVISFS